MAWVITIPDGPVFREVDLTIGECERIELETGKSWRVLHPLNSAQQAKGILVVLYQTREGMADDEARERVNAFGVNAFMDMLTNEDADADLPAEYVDGVPPVAGGPSTGS